MIVELHNLLDSMPSKTIMLVNPIPVYGVEPDTVWAAKCVGLTRVSKNNYNVILVNVKQFYRPIKRTSFIFQNELARQIQLTLVGLLLLEKQQRIYLY